jgi:hypothetical protein
MKMNCRTGILHYWQFFAASRIDLLGLQLWKRFRTDWRPRMQMKIMLLVVVCMI